MMMFISKFYMRKINNHRNNTKKILNGCKNLKGKRNSKILKQQNKK